MYRILEVSDALTYNNSIISLNTSANGLEVFRSINSLLVESPFSLRQYFRIAPGFFSGYGRFRELLDQYVMFSVSTLFFYNAAQFVVSASEAFMVQFGVNPNVSTIVIPTPNTGSGDKTSEILMGLVPSLYL